jgi:hypothetical protein
MRLNTEDTALISGVKPSEFAVLDEFKLSEFPDLRSFT